MVCLTVHPLPPYMERDYSEYRSVLCLLQFNYKDMAKFWEGRSTRYVINE